MEIYCFTYCQALFSLSMVPKRYLQVLKKIHVVIHQINCGQISKILGCNSDTPRSVQPRALDEEERQDGRKGFNHVVEKPGISARSVSQETGHVYETVSGEFRAEGCYPYQLELLGCTTLGSLDISTLHRLAEYKI